MCPRNHFPVVFVGHLSEQKVDHEIGIAPLTPLWPEMCGSSWAQRVSSGKLAHRRVPLASFCWARTPGSTGRQMTTASCCPKSMWPATLWWNSAVLLFPLELQSIPLVTVQLVFFSAPSHPHTPHPYLRRLFLSMQPKLHLHGHPGNQHCVFNRIMFIIEKLLNLRH